MYEYGTTREQLAEVAVAAREWAKLNPKAFVRDGGLSYNHPGMYGLLLLVEAVRQLRVECGDRQVADANPALVHGNGVYSRAKSPPSWARRRHCSPDESSLTSVSGLSPFRVVELGALRCCVVVLVCLPCKEL
jgi:hypothetical protein